MNFKDALKEIRGRAGLTQVALSAQIGVTPNAISNYENGVSFPNETILRKLFFALKCTPDDLFPIAVDSNAEKSDQTQSDDEKELLRDYRSLNDQGKEWVRQSIEMAVAKYKKLDHFSDMEASEEIG